MGMWEQMKAAEAEGEALDAKVRAAARAFRRLDTATPDVERDAQGRTPELEAAARRHLAAYREWRSWAQNELERRDEYVKAALAQVGRRITPRSEALPERLGGWCPVSDSSVTG
jgi:hypothetical protein